jgi:hypothetical protein
VTIASSRSEIVAGLLRMEAIDAQLVEARAKLDAAEAVYRQAQEAYLTETKPLFAEREQLICNRDESEEPAA